MDLRRLKFKRLKARGPRPVPPDGAQLLYLEGLKKQLAFARALVHKRLLPLLPELLDRAAEHRGDAHADAMPPGRRVNRVITGISESFYRVYNHERLETLSTQVARATAAHQKTQLFRQIRETVGIELTSLADRRLGPRIAQFTAENVSLIKTIPSTYFAQVEQRVLAGMARGERHEEMAEDIENRFGVAEDRAKLIARDQVLKFNGALNEFRQTSLGIDSYVWRTVDDSRVRDEHRERDGHTYRWDDPPGDEGDPGDGGHPGDGINCRCYPDPVLDESEEA